jgi:phosphopantothenoylcysteine decarboxylase / phosphopantothenate---cysteine ligase
MKTLTRPKGRLTTPQSQPLRVLITAGPTHEPIDDVRYISNRSSGQMGAALAQAAIDLGLRTTVIVGPTHTEFPHEAQRFNIVTAKQMHEAVLREWPAHDLLIMAAAVADFSPRKVKGKLKRRESDQLVLELDPTPDIVKDAVARRRPEQRAVAFSLEKKGQIARAKAKMRYKAVDLMVYNPIATIDSPDIAPTLLWPDGKTKTLKGQAKHEFAAQLLKNAMALFDRE